MKTFNWLAILCTVLEIFRPAPAHARVLTAVIYINSPDSSITAHIVNKEIHRKTKQGCRYYWYSNNAIISADGSYSGRLLHGKFTSYYPDHFIRQQGQFEYGLKTGVWTRWYKDGTIKERAHFSKGKLNGVAELYDSTGRLVKQVHYRDGVRDGKTTWYRTGKSDSTELFRNGELVVIKDKRRSLQTSQHGTGDTTCATGNGTDNRKKRFQLRKRDTKDSLTDTSSVAQSRKREKPRNKQDEKLHRGEADKPLQEKTKFSDRIRNIFRQKKAKTDTIK